MSESCPPNDGRECWRTEGHDGRCSYRGLKDSAKRKRARALLLSKDDRDVLRDLLGLMRDRKLGVIETLAKDALERLLGRDEP